MKIRIARTMKRTVGWFAELANGEPNYISREHEASLFGTSHGNIHAGYIVVFNRHACEHCKAGAELDVEIEWRDGTAYATSVICSVCGPVNNRLVFRARITRWFPDRAFGFARSEASDARDVFVHAETVCACVKSDENTNEPGRYIAIQNRHSNATVSVPVGQILTVTASMGAQGYRATSAKCEKCSAPGRVGELET